MSQWINRLPIRPIYLTFLLILLYFGIHTGSWTPWLCLVFALSSLIRQYSKLQIIQTLSILAIFSLGFLGYAVKKNNDSQHQPNQVRQVEMVMDTISINGDSLSFRAKSGQQTFQAYYKLKSEAEQTYFQVLSELTELTVVTEVGEPEGQRNFNGFDYRAYLRTQGIYRTLNIEQIEAMKSVKSHQPITLLQVWRRKALVWVKTKFPVPMNNYMTGLLFGELDKDFAEMNDIYSSLGIIHLFALSGLQVGFFIDKIRKFFLRCGLQIEVVNWLQIPFSFVYAGLTGFSASVIRSLVQKIWSNFGVSKLDNLALTVLTCFLILPNFLLTTGGVLSFAYAFVITVMDFEELPKYRKLAFESLTISLGILPIILWYFSSYQPASILLTLVFSFIFDLIMLPGLTIIFLLSGLYPLTQVNFFFVLLEKGIRWVSETVSSSWVIGHPSLGLLLAVLLCLACLYDFRQQKKALFGLSLLVALLFTLIKIPLTNEITVVDVGQGDSIFMQDMRGRNILIDVGGKVIFEAAETWQEKVSQANAERTLIPYLQSRGVSSIDTLLITHTDADHMGDVLEVAEHFKIKEIWTSPGSLTQPDFVAKLKTVNVPVKVTQVGDRLSIFDSQLHVLYPNETGDGGNNDSIVLYGELLKTKFLFTGDLEAQGEAELIEIYPHLQVDVLKAGHHGSKGSSSEAFLDHLQPKVALLSAGKNNRYKHPHKETLERLSERQITDLRTDQQGAIRFSGWQVWQLETVK